MEMRTKKGRGLCLSRILCCGLLVLLWGCLSGTLAAGAMADYTEGYLEYVLTDSGVEITGYFGDETETEVPAMIAGYPVCAIRGGAFADADTLTTVMLPDTVTVIQPGAFSAGQAVVYLTRDEPATGSLPATYEGSDSAGNGTASQAGDAAQASGSSQTPAAPAPGASQTTVEAPRPGTAQTMDADPSSEEIEFDDSQTALSGNTAAGSTTGANGTASVTESPAQSATGTPAPVGTETAGAGSDGGLTADRSEDGNSVTDEQTDRAVNDPHMQTNRLILIGIAAVAVILMAVVLFQARASKRARRRRSRKR